MVDTGLPEDLLDELLTEYKEHRLEIKKMIAELDSIKEKIDRLIPTSLDARYLRFFEEKVKTITSLFNALLDMRKEITKSVKEEIEIRRKVTTKSGEEEIEDLIDIRRAAEKIEDFKREQEAYKKKIKEHNYEEFTDIEIPGVNTVIK